MKYVFKAQPEKQNYYFLQNKTLSLPSLFRYYDTIHAITIARKIYSAANLISDAAMFPIELAFKKQEKLCFTNRKNNEI